MKTNKRKLALLSLLGVLILSGFFMAISSAKKSREEYLASLPTTTPTMTPVPTMTMAPTATFAPTPVPNKELTMLGGGLFASRSAQHLSENGYDLKSENVNTFEYCESSQISSADGIAPGSHVALQDFKENCTEYPVLSEMVVYRTYFTLFTRKDVFMPYFEKAGLVYYNSDDDTFGMTNRNLDLIVDYSLARKSWYEMFTDLGVEISQQELQSEKWLMSVVNLFSPDPGRSSGANSTWGFLAANRAAFLNYEEGDVVSVDPLTKAEVPLVAPDLKKLYSFQGNQNPNSVDFFAEYMSKSFSQPFAFSTESLGISAYNRLSEAGKQKFAEEYAIIYVDNSATSEHLLASFNDDFKNMMRHVATDPEYQRIAFGLGMRSPFSEVSILTTGMPHLREEVLAIGEMNFETSVAFGKAMGFDD